MRVHIGSENPVKVDAVRNMFERLFEGEKIEIKSVVVSSGVPDQPFDDDVVRGAIARAKSALADGDYGVGIEAGLVWQDVLEMYFDVQYCAVVDGAGRLTVGHGSGFRYPPAVLRQVEEGKTVGQAMAGLSGIKQIGKRMGAIGYLSKGLLSRTGLTEQAVLMALLPRLRADIY